MSERETRDLEKASIAIRKLKKERKSRYKYGCCDTYDKQKTELTVIRFGPRILIILFAIGDCAKSFLLANTDCATPGSAIHNSVSPGFTSRNTDPNFL
jgi:hypothetical protein